jgi:hypothetical protein
MSVSCFQGKHSDSYIAKKVKKNVDIKFSAHERFWNNIHQVAQDQKIGKPNNLRLPVSLMKIMCTELSQIDKRCIHVGFFFLFDIFFYHWFVLFCICLFLITH